MDLFEYQGKQYFARFDIPVSPGDVAYTVDEAVAIAELVGDGVSPRLFAESRLGTAGSVPLDMAARS